jgi:membrane protein YdbS with pleckstrin-like domain
MVIVSSEKSGRNDADPKTPLSLSESPLRFNIGASQATVAGSLTGVVPAHLLGDGEQIILAIKPSLWFIVFHSAPLIVIMTLFLIGLRYFFPGEGLSSWSRTIHQVVAAVIFLRLLTSVLLWTSRLYILTDRRILRIKGIFNIDLFECPLVKIQNTFMSLAWYERLLGLGTILFATAGTAGAEAAWQNINQPLEVNELIQKAIIDAQRRWPTAQP